MPTNPALIRLMAYSPIKGRVKIGPEEKMCIAFANALRAMTITGELKAVWSHPANELAGKHKSKLMVALARACGMHVGASDYFFLGAGGSLALEAKSKTGTQSPGQSDFETWCGLIGVPYVVFRSIDEGLDALRAHGMIL